MRCAPRVAFVWEEANSEGHESCECAGHAQVLAGVHRRGRIYFFVAVAFWNLVGAGLSGFMINPPIALSYLQGLNTTPVHAHTALFGVYGTLRWLRVPGDTVFAIGAMVIIAFIAGIGRRFVAPAARVPAADLEPVAGE